MKLIISQFLIFVKVIFERILQGPIFVPASDGAAGWKRYWRQPDRCQLSRHRSICARPVPQACVSRAQSRPSAAPFRADGGPSISALKRALPIAAIPSSERFIASRYGLANAIDPSTVRSRKSSLGEFDNPGMADFQQTSTCYKHQLSSNRP